MTTTKNGIITWLRQWFDDIYALKGESSQSKQLAWITPQGKVNRVNAINRLTTPIRLSSNSNYFTYKEQGVARLKGALINDYFTNTSTWEMQFDYCYPEGMRYCGLIVLADYENPSNRLETFEGGSILGLAGDLPSGTNIYSNPVVTTYKTLHVKRTGSTTLEVWKNDDTANKVTYNWANLPNISKLTVGGRNNGNNTSYGAVYIKNWIVD